MTRTIPNRKRTSRSGAAIERKSAGWIDLPGWYRTEQTAEKWASLWRARGDGFEYRSVCVTGTKKRGSVSWLIARKPVTGILQVE